MGVLARVVTAGTSANPLKDNGEVGVRSCEVGDMSDALNRAGLERDVLDAGLLDLR